MCTEINACLTKKMFMLSNSLSEKINWYFCWSTFLCLGISQDYIVVSQWGGTTYQPPRKQWLCTAEPALPKRPPLSRGHISLSGPDENGPPVWGLRDSCQWQSHHKHRICLSQLLMQVRHRWAICLWIADKILLPWIVRWKSIGHIGDTTISESPNSYHRVQGPTRSCQVKFTPAQIEVSFGGHTQYFPRI